MRKIAFVTQKGGAGKSTLASSVAVAARQAGERVFIIDLDPLQTLVKWSRARGAADIPVEHVPPAKLAQGACRARGKGRDARHYRCAGPGGRLSFGGRARRRSLRHSGAPQRLRSVGVGSNSHAREGERQGLRLSAQPMSARATERARRTRGQGAAGDGRPSRAARFIARRLSGSGAARARGRRI